MTTPGAYAGRLGPVTPDHKPWRIDGEPCDVCGGRASFFFQPFRHGPQLLVSTARWCGEHVPADWLPGRKAVAS